MPVSLLLEDALKGFGVQPGLKRIVSCEWMGHQFPANKTTGVSSEPFCCLAIGYLPIDEAGKALGDAEIDYSIRVGPKFGETLEKCKFAPAQSPGQPLPLRPGSKGPFLEPIADQSGLYDNSKALLFLGELFKIGGEQLKKRFVESQMNVGILIGTEGDVYELVSKNDGTDSGGKAIKDTKMPAFKSIRKFGWEQPAGQVASTHTNGESTASTAPVAGAQDLAIKILSAMSDKHKDKPSILLSDMLKGLMPITSKMN